MAEVILRLWQLGSVKLIQMIHLHLSALPARLKLLSIFIVSVIKKA
jgi:hypothetical protein